MGHTARLRIIRDRFVAGHDSCALCRHLNSMPPETPIQDIVDRCRVRKSHDDTEARRFNKPGPERVPFVGTGLQWCVSHAASRGTEWAGVPN